jgi:nitronate monooxygenase
MSRQLPSELPIAQAPMAGGPSTPELAAAVADAGGFGFLAAGYLTPEALHEALAATRALTGAPLGVNLFVPSPPSDPAPIQAYAERLRPEAERLGAPLGAAQWEDDAYGEKLEVVAGQHLVTFTFGCPAADVVERLHSAGSLVGVTVTAPDEAALAVDAGADLLVVQGTEAGGHQGTFTGLVPNTTPLLTALGAIRETVGLPLVATGGIMTGQGAAAALDAGAVAVQLGTALLCTPEAATSPVHRDALLTRRFEGTVITRAFSGRYARGLRNRFAVEHDDAPTGYPEIHHLTRPLRAAATAAGDADVPNLWAGTGWRAVTDEPAADVVRRIARDLVRFRSR